MNNFIWLRDNMCASILSSHADLDNLSNCDPLEAVINGYECGLRIYIPPQNLNIDIQTHSGSFIYPPNSVQLLHTDRGNRLYCAWSETGDSGMVFKESNRDIIVSKDKPGWNVRVFSGETPHGVWSRCWRYSIGQSI